MIKSPLDYIDELMKRENLTSDYQLSKYLGVSRQLVSNWRHHRAIMDSYHCWRLADALNIDEREVEAAANYQRDRVTKKRQYWHGKWQKLTTRTACISISLYGLASQAPGMQSISLSRDRRRPGTRRRIGLPFGAREADPARR